jgi:Matrixin
MAPQRSPKSRPLATASARFCLLSLVVLGGVLGRVLYTWTDFRGDGNSHGMTALGPVPQSSSAAPPFTPELATIPAPVSDTTLASGEDSTDVATSRRFFPSMEGTYLPDVIAEGGSRVKRWEERVDDPIRVWIAPGDSTPGFRPSFADTVRAAFLSWEGSGVPVRFAFVESADSAEVRVGWADHLPQRRAGLTHWWKDPHGWLTKANIVLAMQLSDDGRADETSMHRMALHEVGHVLGLEHSVGTGDIMAAWVSSNELTARDRATARLLYTLQPGVIRQDVSALGS